VSYLRAGESRPREAAEVCGVRVGQWSDQARRAWKRWGREAVRGGGSQEVV